MLKHWHVDIVTQGAENFLITYEEQCYFRHIILLNFVGFLVVYNMARLNKLAFGFYWRE